ncbi:MAG: L,D-transpeptidase [Allosphingosinicella sp.]
MRLPTLPSLATPGIFLALLGAWPAVAEVAPRAAQADFAAQRASPEARSLADWVVGTNDAQGLPFVIVDKIEARVFAFDASGLLVGSVPALLGLARGDEAPADIGSRRLADIPPGQRITPAGRFASGLGRNLGGQEILWIDYDAALSLHRVIATNRAERRLQRLATPSGLDNRISYGCINVPADFFESVILPLFRPAAGIVYILPELRPLGDPSVLSHPGTR